MMILMAALEAGTQHPYLGAFFMIVIGVVTFLVGFKQYRAYRILADAPKARVRSVPMGLVHLHGKATGDPLTSPLTGTRCFTFTADIEEWVKTRNKRGGTTWAWRTTAGDDDLKEFYLDDGTGRVLVKPGGAEGTIDLQRTFDCEIGEDGHFKSASPTPGIPAPTEEAVWAYIHGPHNRRLADKAFELEAASIPGIDPARAKEFMMGVLNAGRQIQSSGIAPHVESFGTLQDRASGLGKGPYRVTEKCFLAESDCVILGTCTENPDAKSDEDRNLIRKGENEKTFLISTHGEGKIGRGLRLQAGGLVFLGAALIIGAVALALNAAKML
ncbi:MAG: hypothetical protein ACE145_19285 [Terriglobia bacterium]